MLLSKVAKKARRNRNSARTDDGVEKRRNAKNSCEEGPLAANLASGAALEGLLGVRCQRYLRDSRKALSVSRSLALATRFLAPDLAGWSVVFPSARSPNKALDETINAQNSRAPL